MNDVAVTLEAAELPAPVAVQPAGKAIDFAKVDALRKHMLLTVASMCVVLGSSRVSYYGWLKGTIPRAQTTKHIREVVRKLVSCVHFHSWPGPAVFVASQPERLIMLQELLKSLDNEPTPQ